MGNFFGFFFVKSIFHKNTNDWLLTWQSSTESFKVLRGVESHFLFKLASNSSPDSAEPWPNVTQNRTTRKHLRNKAKKMCCCCLDFMLFSATRPGDNEMIPSSSATRSAAWPSEEILGHAKYIIYLQPEKLDSFKQMRSKKLDK